MLFIIITHRTPSQSSRSQHRRHHTSVELFPETYCASKIQETTDGDAWKEWGGPGDKEMLVSRIASSVNTPAIQLFPFFMGVMEKESFEHFEEEERVKFTDFRGSTSLLCFGGVDCSCVDLGT